MASSLQVGTTLNNLKDIPVEPDQINWGLNDISAPDAGRVQDANCTMEKRRVGQKRKLSLSWANPTLAQASAVLKAFAPEYVYVRFLDVQEGQMITRRFYTGDKAAPFRQIDLRNPNTPAQHTVMSSLSFDVIER